MSGISNSSDMQSQVLKFYEELFATVFWNRYSSAIDGARKQRDVRRQIEEAADAASHHLEHFFAIEQLPADRVTPILDALKPLGSSIDFDDLCNSHVPTDVVMESVQQQLPALTSGDDSRMDALFGLSTQIVVETLAHVGRVLVEWQKQGFVSDFQALERCVEQLSSISKRSLHTVVTGSSDLTGSDPQDEYSELQYRYRIYGRFLHVEAGTVKLIPGMLVDQRHLFVMPRLKKRKARISYELEGDADELMDLSSARRLRLPTFAPTERSIDDEPEEQPVDALEFVRGNERIVIVGVPGSGKSTLLESLLINVSRVESDWDVVLNGAQAIPVLLRVRELDPDHLPWGDDIIAVASGSKKELASLLPAGWLDRQSRAGRVLFLVDGLDEADPERRDKLIIPWLKRLCAEYPRCRFVVSSRPVGFVSGTLSEVDFVECELQDFTEVQQLEYCQHWCAAVLMARDHISTEQAVDTGRQESAQIVAGVRQHEHISDLARNPLMLSAICLVNYFEGGNLPDDRAILYRFCVEGLLHSWDERRRIRSEFKLSEKLAVCREVALAMQAENLAELPEQRLLQISTNVLGGESRASTLLAHMRHRSGLLVQRRHGVYGFAHLTFQEYLAAVAILEVNQLNMTLSHLAEQHTDDRWREVIRLVVSVAASQTSQRLIRMLIGQDDSNSLAEIIGDCIDAHSSLGSEVRREALERIACHVAFEDGPRLDRFADDEIAMIANDSLYLARSEDCEVSEITRWMSNRLDIIDRKRLASAVTKQEWTTKYHKRELIYFAYRCLKVQQLADADTDLLIGEPYSSGDTNILAEAAFLGIMFRGDLRVARTLIASITDRLAPNKVFTRPFIAGLTAAFWVSSTSRHIDRKASYQAMVTFAVFPGAVPERRRFTNHLLTLSRKIQPLNQQVSDHFRRWHEYVKETLK